MALRAEAAILGRNKAIATANLESLRRIYVEHPAVFEPGVAENLAFSSPRILQGEDASSFAIDLIRATGVLVMPWAVWQSPLGRVPTNRVRIGLGNPNMPAALFAIDAHLRDTALGRTHN